ncbi:nose resistant to fluoxetine protein 6-like [Dermacentor silvarum]|uniref:nose resistant to fluoxetine protein 6-like n=1 Tax=Dermacentor silvarum TaxID=543639 RepID=UPI001897E31D|nr:nose resistant to fluoxetine protein 6-like [Dermacentor silvarum]
MCFYLLPRVVNGPDARAGFQKMFDEITNHWWQLLLQIRNFYETTVSDVLLHTWYLSADFQLYLVSLLTLLILKGHKTALVAAFTVFSLIGCAFGMWVLVSRDLLPFQIFPGPDMPLLTRTLSEFYVRPYYHAVCYFSGCMTFLLMGDFRKRKITKGTQLAGWCVSVSCGLISVFAKLAWYRSPNPTSEAVTLLAAFFDRILWSVFIVWITLACASGRGGFVARFLSWNAFVPLSKLSFGVYLIHLPFIQLMLHASRERVLWSKFNLVTLWLSVVVWSFLLSYLTFLACEAPTAKLNSLIFGRMVGRGDPRKQKQPEQSA